MNTARLILRRPLASDADEMHDLFADEATCMLYGFPHFAACDAGFLAAFAPLTNSDDALAVIVPGDGRLVGLIHLEDAGESLSFRIVLHPDYRGLGYAQEALNALFAACGKASVICTVQEDNLPARKLINALHFVQENNLYCLTLS